MPRGNNFGHERHEAPSMSGVARVRRLHVIGGARFQLSGVRRDTQARQLTTDSGPNEPATFRVLYLQLARARNCETDPGFIEGKLLEYCSYIFWEFKNNLAFGYSSDLLFEQSEQPLQISTTLFKWSCAATKASGSSSGATFWASC